MAVLSFCLGAASVVAAAYVHKFVQERRSTRNAHLATGLMAIRDGQEVTDRTLLNELYRKGWVADVPGGRALTAAGADFLALQQPASPEKP